MKISIKHNDRDGFVCLPSPTPTTRSFATHPVRLYYSAVKSPPPLFWSLHFVLPASSIQRETLPCREALRCNDKPFLLQRSSHDREKCTPGSYLLQWPRYSNSMTTSLPPLLGPLPSNFPSSSVWASLSTVNPDVLSSLHPRTCPLEGGIRSCRF